LFSKYCHWDTKFCRVCMLCRWSLLYKFLFLALGVSISFVARSRPLKCVPALPRTIGSSNEHLGMQDQCSVINVSVAGAPVFATSNSRWTARQLPEGVRPIGPRSQSIASLTLSGKLMRQDPRNSFLRIRRRRKSRNTLVMHRSPGRRGSCAPSPGRGAAKVGCRPR